MKMIKLTDRYHRDFYLNIESIESVTPYNGSTVIKTKSGETHWPNETDDEVVELINKAKNGDES